MSTSSHRPDSGGFYLVGVLLTAWLLAYLDRQVILILTPLLKADLMLSDTQVSLVQGFAFAAFFAVAGLPIGRLVDRHNRRNIIMAGLAIWSVMTILCGLASDFWMLLAARMGVGAGEACLAPAAFSLIADYFPAEKRGRAIAVTTVGAGLGGVASGIVGGAILKLLDGHMTMVPILGTLAPWRMVLIIVGMPGLLVALLMLTIREPSRTERSADLGIKSASFFPYILEHRRTFGPLYASFSLHAVGGFAVNNWVPVLLMRSYGIDPANAGFITGAALLVATPASALAGGAVADALVSRHPNDGRVRASILVCSTSSLFVLLLLLPSPVTTLVGYMGLIFMANALTTISYGALQDLVSNEMRGQVIALHLLLIGLVGGGLGPMLVALVTDFWFGDEARLAHSIAIIAFPAVLLCLPVLLHGRKAYASTRSSLLKEKS